MPRPRDITVSLTGTQVIDAPTGTAVDLGSLHGVHVMVLMRHRH